MLELLLDKGGDARAAGEGGWTPLHLACRVGKEDRAGLLIQVRAARPGCRRGLCVCGSAKVHALVAPGVWAREGEVCVCGGGVLVCWHPRCGMGWAGKEPGAREDAELPCPHDRPPLNLSHAHRRPART